MKSNDTMSVDLNRIEAQGGRRENQVEQQRQQERPSSRGGVAALKSR